MFPYTEDDHNPLESTLFKKLSFHDQQIQNPIHDSPFFSNFPSPLFDENELPSFVFPQYSPPSDHHFTQTTNASASQLPIISKGPPRKRTGKKDRHSKICTAQGVRDRRMRLSLQVARKFFDLQDMLGYDKASKTIEWLFCKSNKAIKDLTKAANPNPNTESECEEVVSGIEECHEVMISTDDANPKKKKLARDLARERARCRTREKKMMSKLGFNSISIGHYSPADEGTIEKLLQGINQPADPSTNNFLVKGIFGNWEDDQVMNSTDTRIVTNPLVSLQKPAAGNSTSDFTFFHPHI